MSKRGSQVHPFSLLARKRGLSTIIVTLILVLLSIVAVGIVWAVISNIISESSRGITLSSLTLDLDIKNAKIQGGNVVTSVTRKQGAGDLVGIKFIFSDGSDSESTEETIALKELEEETFAFTPEELNSSNIKTVSVAPIYNSGGENVLGGITDTFNIKLDSGTGGAGGDTGGNDGDTGGDTGGTGGAVCGNEICETEEDAISCPSDCSTGGSTSTCGNSALDAGEGCDGGANCIASGAVGECTCTQGFMPTTPESLNCIVETTINTGTIDSVWPVNAIKYFDSNSLPKSPDVTNYIGKYVKFPGSTETRCLRISYAEYLSDISYDKSYIRLELVSSIQTGNNYEVWHSSTCGS